MNKLEKIQLLTDTQAIARRLNVKHNKILIILDQVLKMHPEVECRVKYEKREYHGSTFDVALLPKTVFILLMQRIESKNLNKFKLSIAEQISNEFDIMNALENFDFDDVDDDLTVYVIKNELTGNVKIGISRDPVARLKQLQVGNDGKLTLLCTISASNGFSDESTLHNRFERYNVRGEWFSGNVINESFALQSN